MGWREARSMLTVVTSVSDHVSRGPKGVCDQSKARVSSAISPVPMIREGGRPPAISTTFSRLDRCAVKASSDWLGELFSILISNTEIGVGEDRPRVSTLVLN